MNGKSKCKILKDIRRQIAAENDIEYVTSECKYQGDCTGTCPKCEAEVRYLEQELEKRQKAGKAIAVAGIAAALVLSAAGCGMDTNSTAGDSESSARTSQIDPSQTSPTLTPPGGDDLMGEPAYPDPTTEPKWSELTGDINFDPDYTTTELAGFPAPDDDYTLPAGVPAPDDYIYVTPGTIPEP